MRVILLCILQVIVMSPTTEKRAEELASIILGDDKDESLPPALQEIMREGATS
jgi:hypothetical protein